MPVFRCFIRGDNFPGSLAGESDLIGFYTTRFIEGSSVSEAELAALEMLRAEPEFWLMRPGGRTEDAQVYFEQIEEVQVELGRGPGKGFTILPNGHLAIHPSRCCFATRLS